MHIQRTDLNPQFLLLLRIIRCAVRMTSGDTLRATITAEYQ